MSIQDLPSIRIALANLLGEQVPGLATVLPYEDAVDNRELPCLMIWRDEIRRRNSNEAEDQLYAYKSSITWNLRLYTLVLPGDRVNAQEAHDAIIMDLFAVLDANDLLDPNGPGQVEDLVLESMNTEVIPASTLANRQTPEMLFSEGVLVTYSNTD